MLEFDSDALIRGSQFLASHKQRGIAGLELEFDDSNTIQIPGIDLETRNMRPYGTAGYEISQVALSIFPDPLYWAGIYNSMATLSFLIRN